MRMSPSLLFLAPPPEDDVFYESLEHDNDAILDRVTHHRTLPYVRLHQLLYNNGAQSSATLPVDITTPPLTKSISKNCITVNNPI